MWQPNQTAPRSKSYYHLAGASVLAAALLAPAAHAGHGGSNSPDLQVVGQFSVPIEGLTTDVWAFGNYAYVGSFDEAVVGGEFVCSLDITGVRIIDISDPANPFQVAFIPAQPGTRNNDVKVEHIETPFFSGEILVASNEPCGTPFNPRLNSRGKAQITGQGGIAIWNVTDPTRPRSLKRNFLPFGVHNTFIWQQGSNAYLIAVDDDNIQDVHIVDITRPQSPREIAVTGQQDWPDLSVNIAGPAVFLHDVWVQENSGRFIAYLSYWDAGLVLLDVTDPRAPVFLGDSDYPDPDPLTDLPPEGNSHVAVPDESGEIVVMGDEDFAEFSVVVTHSLSGGFPAGIALFGPQLSDPGVDLSGDLVWSGGEGCTASAVPAAPTPDSIALIQRGTCFFQDKAEAAFTQGYTGYIVANDAARGEEIINMSPRDAGPFPPIPGVFVAFSAGEAMKDGTGVVNGTVSAALTFDGWGFMRVLDVVAPGNIVQLGHFATEGVFDLGPGLEGDRTAHNVIVRDGLAYWSWYWEGMRVVDFSGCAVGGGLESCTPTEVAHFVDDGTGPDSLNDHSNFWGVYLHDHPTEGELILGSDRDSGLWIFRLPEIDLAATP